MAKKTLATKGTDVAIAQAVATMTEATGFLPLREFDFGSVISEEMDGLDAVFERIKMPSGDTTVFQIPSDDPEEPELAKEFSAVILYHHPIRAFFKGKYNGGTNPPDCGSLDAVTGYGDPGGDCESCPLNVFGTGENGAKACKSRRRLYLMREGEVFPVMLSLPTGSLKDFSRYLMRLITKGMNSGSVVTRFSLVKATNKGGVVYAKASFRMERKLSAEEIPIIDKLSEQVKAVSHKVGFEQGNGNADAGDGMGTATDATFSSGGLKGVSGNGGEYTYHAATA